MRLVVGNSYEAVAAMAERNGLTLERAADKYILKWKGRLVYGLDHKGVPASDLDDIARFITHQD